MCSQGLDEAESGEASPGDLPIIDIYSGFAFQPWTVVRILLKPLAVI